MKTGGRSKIMEFLVIEFTALVTLEIFEGSIELGVDIFVERLDFIKIF